MLVAWGNPPGQDNIGMLFPAKHTPFDEGTWAVTISYEDDGHVSDADAAGIDYSQLLNEMRSDIRAGNPERESDGYPPIELVGWAEPPRYDASSRKLYWAKELRFGDSDDSTLNYEIRALGRTGVLSMTFIADTAQLGEINHRRESVLHMAEFNPGKRYEDFDSNIDEVAAYGIGGDSSRARSPPKRLARGRLAAPQEVRRVPGPRARGPRPQGQEHVLGQRARLTEQLEQAANRTRLRDDDEQNTEDRAAKVRVVVDSPFLLAAGPVFVRDVAQRKQRCRNRHRDR